MNFNLDLNVQGNMNADEIKATTITADNFVQTGGGSLSFASLDVTGDLSVGGVSTLNSAAVTNALTAGSLATTGAGTLSVPGGLSALHSLSVTNNISAGSIDVAALTTTGAASFAVHPLSSDLSVPTATALVTKSYVDSEISAQVQGMHPREPVVVATTAAITLSGFQTIDDVPLGDGDRVLVKNQGDATENSIYLARAGAWDVAPNMQGEVTGAYVFVLGGTTNDDSSWVQNTVGNAGVAQQWTLFSIVTPEITDLASAPTAVNVAVTNTAGTNATINAATAATSAAGVVTAAQAGVLSGLQARRVTEIQLLYGGSSGAGTVIFDMPLVGGADTFMVRIKGMAYASSTGEVNAVDSWGILDRSGAGALTWVEGLGASSEEPSITAAGTNFSFIMNFGTPIARTGFFTVSMFSIVTGAPLVPTPGFQGVNVNVL